MSLNAMAAAPIVNPFFFEMPGDRWSFTDRETLVPVLLEFFSQRARRLLVHGRRCMGKTFLLQNAAARVKTPLVYADVSMAANYAHLAKKLLEAAPAAPKGALERAIELAKKHFPKFALKAGKIVFEGALRDAKGETTPEQVLGYLNGRAAEADAPWTIYLDEFHDIRKLGDERFDWQIRGITQPRRSVNYIFSGSDHRLIQRMSEYDLAFFKQLQQLEVGPVESAHMGNWINERWKVGGLGRGTYGGRIVDIAGPCTGDIVRLAKVAFDIAAHRKGDDAVATAFDSLALSEITAEFSDRWRDLSLAQHSILRTVAAGKQPSAAQTLIEFGVKSVSTA